MSKAKLIKIGLSGLIYLAKNPETVGQILDKAGKMPNIKTPTMGGKVFWDDLVDYNGWRLQRNSVFGNCRILNPEDKRVAWGGETEMIKLIESFK